TRGELGSLDPHASPPAAPALAGRTLVGVAEPTSVTPRTAVGTVARLATGLTWLPSLAARGTFAFGDLPIRPDRLQADLALGVDVLDEDRQLVALAHGLFDGAQALALAQLRDVDEPVAA